MKKRLLASLLALVMVLSMVPAALAEEDLAPAEEPRENEPVCTCETRCTEEAVNADCPVCGGEAGPAACAGAPAEPQEDEAVCICTALCIEESVNADCPVCGGEAGPAACACVDGDWQGNDDAVPMEDLESGTPPEAEPESPSAQNGAAAPLLEVENRAENVWRVGSNEDLNKAVEEIEEQRGQYGLKEATIALTKDIVLDCLNPDDSTSDYSGENYFAGIEGVTVTLTSADKAEGEEGYHLTNFGLTAGNYDDRCDFGKNSGKNARFLIGPIIFDHITLCGNETWLIAQGHSVVFTKKFRNLSKSGSSNNNGILNVVGGMMGLELRQMGEGFESNSKPGSGLNDNNKPSNRKKFPNNSYDNKFGWVPDSAKVVQDTNIEIYGGYFGYVIGGSYNGHVYGDTNIKIALDPTQLNGYSNIHNIGYVVGGNMLTANPDSEGTNRGIIYGDTHVNAISGTFGDIYGGSEANFWQNKNDDMGQIWGDTHVTVGRENGMEARFSNVYGGGLRSTIGHKERILNEDYTHKGYGYFGGNTHVTINNTAVGILSETVQGGVTQYSVVADVHGGGDMDLIWGTTEVILNGGKQVDWVFAGGSNSDYERRARIYNMIPNAEGQIPQTAAHIVVKGGTWNEIYACHKTFNGTNKLHWIRGDVVMDFNGGTVNSFCLSGPYTSIGIDISEKDRSYEQDTLGKSSGAETPEPLDADSILNVNGGNFSPKGLLDGANASIRGYRYTTWEDNSNNRYGKVIGDRNVNFCNQAPMTVYGMESIDNTALETYAEVSINSCNLFYDKQYYYMDSMYHCKNLSIASNAELSLADGASLTGDLTIQQGGILALPIKTSSDVNVGSIDATTNACLRCDGTATGVAGGLRTVDQASVQVKDSYFWATGDELRPAVGQVYVRANNLGAGTENGGATAPADSSMLNLVNSEPDLYVEYVPSKGTDPHMWRIARDQTVQVVTVKYFKYKKSDGTWLSNSTDKDVAVGRTVGTLPTEPTRTGYEFAGWNLAEGGSGKEFTADTVIFDNMVNNGVVSVYGQWNPIVTFDANGGSWAGGVTKQEVAAGDNGKVTPPANPTNGNQAFVGWYTAVDGGKQIDLDTAVFDAPTTLYAHWGAPAPMVKVTYSPKGAPGGVTLPADESIPKGSKYTAKDCMNIPDGWRLEGWYTDAALSEGTKFTTGVVDQDITLYGKWIRTYTITYEDGVKDEVVFSDQSYIADEGDATPAFFGTPSRAGYTFRGWKPEVAQTVTKDVTYVAQWEKNASGQFYTVTYDLNGGTGASSEYYRTVSVRKGEHVIVKNAPSRSGYTFEGWSDGATIHQPGAELIVTRNITLTAQWHKNSSGGGGDGNDDYILHYESNGGTEYKDERYSKNTVVKLDKVPTREGYTFTGWYADKGLTNRITSIKMTSDKTVYAGWEPTSVPEWLNGKDHFAYVMGYADGTMRPLNKISRAEVATIFFRLLNEDVREENLTTVNTFADVNEGMWCNTAISTMTRLRVVHGRTAECFDPNAPITRAEFAAICARFDASRHDGESNFTDIAGHWAEAEIERAASLGWVRGYADGTFRPGNHITRAEAMTMINRVLNRLPEDEDDLLDGMNIWPDNQPGDWHYLAVQEATNSHDFTRKSDAVHEHWTKLTPDPDWIRYQ